MAEISMLWQVWRLGNGMGTGNPWLVGVQVVFLGPVPKTSTCAAG